jgi:tetratricopeptide (TPR) repeat protein
MRFSHICIVARSMRRPSLRFASVVLLAAAIVSVSGCESLDGRNRNRKGNKLYRETKFVEAAAEYEKALSQVKDPAIEYNLGLAYSKITKPGYEKPILLDVAGSFACTAIPGVKNISKKVCLRGDDKRFLDCNSKKDCPADSYECSDTSLCTLTAPELADKACGHFLTWVNAQPSDDEIKAKLKVVKAELEEAKAKGEKQQIDKLGKQVDELESKDNTRKLMTQLWDDSDQFPKATAYWETLLKERPDDPEIMLVLGGIALKAEDWRKSISWYRKVAEVAKDKENKLAAYTYIGRVSRAKLASKSLGPADSIEIADFGIGALQKANDLAPNNAANIGLLGNIFGLRSLSHGASFAAALDRATAQDLLKVQGVLNLEAKKAREGQAPAGPKGSVAPTVKGTETPAPKTGG